VHDVTADPQLVDGRRTLAAWARELAGPLGTPLAIASITAAAQTVETIPDVRVATFTRNGHGYVRGDVVVVSGANESEYTGRFDVFNVTANTFDALLAAQGTGAPALPGAATGAPVITRVGTTVRARPRLAAQCDRTKALYNAAHTVTAYLAWELAGSMPQNTALATAAHDGTTIGAADVATGGGPSAPTGLAARRHKMVILAAAAVAHRGARGGRGGRRGARSAMLLD
jgi:hypothetical protein